MKSKTVKTTAATKKVTQGTKKTAAKKAAAAPVQEIKAAAPSKQTLHYREDGAVACGRSNVTCAADLAEVTCKRCLIVTEARGAALTLAEVAAALGTGAHELYWPDTHTCVLVSVPRYQGKAGRVAQETAEQLFIDGWLEEVPVEEGRGLNLMRVQPEKLAEFNAKYGQQAPAEPTAEEADMIEDARQAFFEATDGPILAAAAVTELTITPEGIERVASEIGGTPEEVEAAAADYKIAVVADEPSDDQVDAAFEATLEAEPVTPESDPYLAAAGLSPEQGVSAALALLQAAAPPPPPPPADEPAAAPAAAGTRDPRLPEPGSVIRKTWRYKVGGEFLTRDLEVTVRENDFEFEGAAWKSLSAIGKHLTGQSTNGFAFFGLTGGSAPTGRKPRAQGGTPAAPPKHAKVFGEYSVSAVLRWMGREGFTEKEARAALTSVGVTVESNIRGPLGAGRPDSPRYDDNEIPKLTDEQAATLRAARTDKA